MISRYLTGLLFVFSFSSVWSGTGVLDRIISVEIKNTPIKTVLLVIEKRASVQFSYNPDLIEENKIVSLNIQRKTIAYGLSLIFNKSVRFKEVGKHIVLLKNEDMAELRKRKKSSSFTRFKGVITNKNTGEPVQGVSIYDIDARYASVSDPNGNYSLQIPKAETVRSLYIRKKGFKEHVFVVDATYDSLIVRNIRLEPNSQRIEKMNPKEAERIYLPIEERAISGALVSYDTYVHAENLEEIEESRIAQISLVPSVSIGSNLSTNGLITNNYSLNILAGYSNGVNGAELGGIINMVKEDARWVQVGGICNLVGGDFTGMQAGGILNSVRGDFLGVQLSGIGGNAGGNFNGVQAGGIIALTHKKFIGIQLGGLAAATKGRLSGVQVGGLFSAARCGFKGVQLSGIGGNAGGNFKGVQLGGLATATKGRLSGVQVGGLFSAARCGFRGVQLSGIGGNAGGNFKGVQLGGLATATKGRLSGVQVGGLFSAARCGFRGVQLSGIGGNAGGSFNGVQLGGLATATKGRLSGVQVGGLFSAARCGFKGVQLSGIGGNAGGSFNGVQLGGLAAAVKGRLSGVQVGGLFSAARCGFRGVQLSGISNFTDSVSYGWQLTGIHNTAYGELRGGQISGITNFSRRGINFLQLSGIGNVADKNNGLQLGGIFNYARKNNGFQLGLINVSNEGEGVSLGLINFVRKGYLKTEIAANEIFQANVTLKSGKRFFYNTYHFSARFGTNQAYASGLGFGTNFNLKDKWTMSCDLSAQVVFENEFETFTQLYRFSTTVDRQLANWVTLFFGPAMSVNVVQFANAEGKYETNIGFAPVYDEVFQSGRVLISLGGQVGFRF